MELIFGSIVLIALILLIRKAGVIEPNRNVASNLQPSQDIPQHIPTTQNIPQNTPPQNNSNILNDIAKAGLIGTGVGLGMVGSRMLFGRNYYNYYYPREPDTALVEHLHDLIWNDDCNKCDNDVIYNIFSSCDDTGSDNSDSSCSSSWDDNYDNNNYDDNGYSWNSWDSGDDSSC
jgi:hypothetical protein